MTTATAKRQQMRLMTAMLYDARSRTDCEAVHSVDAPDGGVDEAEEDCF